MSYQLTNTLICAFSFALGSALFFFIERSRDKIFFLSASILLFCVVLALAHDLSLERRLEYIEKLEAKKGRVHQQLQELPEAFKDSRSLRYSGKIKKLNRQIETELQQLSKSL